VVRSLDLHGLTVDEAMGAVDAFLNDALLAGAAEARIIHGRSGGRLKVSLHAQLKRISSIRSYALDPRNAGVTVVKFGA
jgi:DNA mismatch repair protein MutS2